MLGGVDSRKLFFLWVAAALAFEPFFELLEKNILGNISDSISSGSRIQQGDSELIYIC